MIPAHILCNPSFWPSIAKDSEILRQRIAAVDRLRLLRERLAASFEPVERSGKA